MALTDMATYELNLTVLGNNLLGDVALRNDPVSRL